MSGLQAEQWQHGLDNGWEHLQIRFRQTPEEIQQCKQSGEVILSKQWTTQPSNGC